MTGQAYTRIVSFVTQQAYSKGNGEHDGMGVHAVGVIVTRRAQVVASAGSGEGCGVGGSKCDMISTQGRR